jgi:hypothetical protein
MYHIFSLSASPLYNNAIFRWANHSRCFKNAGKENVWEAQHIKGTVSRIEFLGEFEAI